MNSTPTGRDNFFHQLLQCRNSINNILSREFNYRDNNTHIPLPNHYFPPPIPFQYNPYIPYHMRVPYYPYYQNNPDIFNSTSRNSNIPIFQHHYRRNIPTNSTSSRNNRTSGTSRNNRNTANENSINSINSLINILDQLNSRQTRYRNSNNINSTSNTNNTGNNINRSDTQNENSNNINQTEENNNVRPRYNQNYFYDFIPQYNSLLSSINRNNPEIYQNLDSISDTSPTAENRSSQNNSITDTTPQIEGGQRFRDRIRQVLPELVEITLYSDGRPINTDSMQDVEVPTNLNILRQNTTVSSFSNVETSEDRCCICREIFQDTDIVRKINSCGHVFHINCVETWLESNTTCPMCRHDIRDNNIIPTENSGINENSDTNDILNPNINYNFNQTSIHDDSIEEVN